MEYPIVKTKTTDGYVNYGLFLETEKPKAVCIAFHGTAGYFYNDDFIETISKKIIPEGISLLSTNNRGSGVYNMYEHTGAAVEIFKDCLFDIDAWIEFTLAKGYKKIILCGHSLGAEKIIYYKNKGLYKDKIEGIIMLAPADSSRWRLYDEHYNFSEKGKNLIESLLKEAGDRIKENKLYDLMDVNTRTGFMPRLPASVLDILDENSELIKVLPFHSGKLPMLHSISVPILAILGNQREYTGISPTDALELMKKENPKVKTFLIEDADHVFTGFESEVAKTLCDFILNDIILK